MCTDSLNRLPLLELSGEPYDMGVELGRFGQRAVNEHLKTTQAWALVTAYRDDARIQRMRRQVEERFPRYLLELQGLADGLQMPFNDVFAWNCRGDIRALAPDGCTTVQIPGAVRVVAHNEDGDPGLRGYCAMVRAVPREGTAFTAFIYPGSLPGHTFAATDAGLVQTVNNIRALDASEGLPRMLLTRAVLDCRSLDEAVTLIHTSEKAGAFHLTLTKVDDPRLLSVEFTASACSVKEIVAPEVHANHLIHDLTESTPQIVTASSVSRQRRGGELILSRAATRDPLIVLRDQLDRSLPILRDDPCDPDDENTLATAVFFVGAEGLECQVYDNLNEPARFHIREKFVSAA